MKYNTIKSVVPVLAPFSLTTAYAFLGIGEPPLAISTRDDCLMGPGKVLIIVNTSDKPIHNVTVAAENFELHQTLKLVVVAVTLGPHETVEVGWAEVKWRFQYGEQVNVCAYGYFSDIRRYIPK